jgi:hypothetical protein
VDFIKPAAFNLQVQQLVLCGRESRELVANRFGWPYPGWRRKFRTLPWVDWTSGGHGRFFKVPHVDVLWAHIGRFLNGQPPEMTLGARLSRYSWFFLRTIPLCYAIYQKGCDVLQKWGKAWADMGNDETELLEET